MISKRQAKRLLKATRVLRSKLDHETDINERVRLFWRIQGMFDAYTIMQSKKDLYIEGEKV